MKKVWCVITSENIYANVQVEESPILINYDLNNDSCWKPFLTKSLRDKYFHGDTKITDARVQPGAPEKI